ncbi:kinase-like domain-containing protein [Lasiosphaeria ovina]|uniref:Kinase-like domain-containing protein n=1 Tax=Lasiosphaeria ovina TaxID=92902 RepID=A0AAE0KIB2_9PEZI|nr:kinase-like domain-containing protein [Lasiosphaeria ovina]
MSSPRPQSSEEQQQPVDVLEMNEGYEKIAGTFQFTGTLIVYRTDSGDLHHAIPEGRYSSRSEVKIEDLRHNVLITVSAYSPLFPEGFTRAPDPLPQNCHVKKPRLNSYDRIQHGPRPDEIAETVLLEAEVRELLAQHPHPNVATYLGCQVSPDGRITGLCFETYQCTLMQRVNPGSLMKRRPRSHRQRGEDYSGLLAGVESGIKHLHALGLVHNDTNPSNIMLDGSGNAVIIDFGPCRRVGESLEGVGRTYEWYDEKIETALPQNDLDALEEIRIWLGDDDSKLFQFDE